jgi:hypothetical protein
MRPLRVSDAGRRHVCGYATGVFSSRKIARKLHAAFAFRVLDATNFSAHRTISDFRAAPRLASAGRIERRLPLTPALSQSERQQENSLPRRR